MQTRLRMLDFINDEKEIDEIINFSDDDLAGAAAESQVILYKLQKVVNEKKIDEVCSILCNSKTNDLIRENLSKNGLIVKFLMLYLLLGSTPRTAEWFTSVLNITEKISWKEFWKRFLEAGEPVIDRFLIDMFKEIIEIQTDLQCGEEIPISTKENIVAEETKTDINELNVFEKITEYIGLLLQIEKPIDDVEELKNFLSSNDVTLDDVKNFIKEVCESDLIQCDEKRTAEILQNENDTYELFIYLLDSFFKVISGEENSEGEEDE